MATRKFIATAVTICLFQFSLAELALAQQTRTQITNTQVGRSNLASPSYKASGEPNLDEARRVVTALGVGKHVQVKLANGKKFRGHVQAIEADYFTLLPDRQSETVRIAYPDVSQVKKNLSGGATIAIVVGIAAVVVIAALILRDDGQRQIQIEPPQ